MGRSAPVVAAALGCLTLGCAGAASASQPQPTCQEQEDDALVSLRGLEEGLPANGRIWLAPGSELVSLRTRAGDDVGFTLSTISSTRQGSNIAVPSYVIVTPTDLLDVGQRCESATTGWAGEWASEFVATDLDEIAPPVPRVIVGPESTSATPTRYGLSALRYEFRVGATGTERFGIQVAHFSDALEDSEPLDVSVPEGEVASLVSGQYTVYSRFRDAAEDNSLDLDDWDFLADINGIDY